MRLCYTRHEATEAAQRQEIMSPHTFARNSSHADVMRFMFACANGRLTCFGRFLLLF